MLLLLRMWLKKIIGTSSTSVTSCEYRIEHVNEFCHIHYMQKIDAKWVMNRNTIKSMFAVNWKNCSKLTQISFLRLSRVTKLGVWIDPQLCSNLYSPVCINSMQFNFSRFEITLKRWTFDITEEIKVDLNTLTTKTCKLIAVNHWD